MHIFSLLFLVTLMVPNAILVVTERQPVGTALADILLPLGCYMLLTGASRRIGRTVWLMFPLIFLAAFQIVLLGLFGESVVGVDMFLNLVTTNATEAGEMLGGLLPAVGLVVALYIPVLVWASVEIKRGIRLTHTTQRRYRRSGLVCLMAGLIAALATLPTQRPVAWTEDIFPANALCNLSLAVQRSYRVAHYAETSKGFTFHAKRQQLSDTTSVGNSPVVVVVIGETARADHFALFGYCRPTTPMLAKLTGLTAFPHAFSESNTTHKSVPMLLSDVTAADFDSLYMRRSLITAFREAGYRTAFFSNQQRNHSFIDFFGEEADTCLFIKDRSPKENVLDAKLIDYARREIAATRGPLLVVLHTYGSHFNYSDRYPAKFRRFRPDTPLDAKLACRPRLVNAYDNTILYTDYLLATLCRSLAATGRPAVMLYTSDHGEDIFDDGHHFLHASPRPTLHQLHVPLLVWTSPQYAAAHTAAVAALGSNTRREVSTSATLFHTTLMLGDISTPLLKPWLSLASSAYHPTPPLYLTDRNHAMPMARVLR